MGKSFPDYDIELLREQQNILLCSDGGSIKADM